MLRDDGSLSGQIVKLPAFVARWISDKDALLYVRTQCTLLVLLHMYICKVASNVQMRDIWLLAIEDFKGCFI